MLIKLIKVWHSSEKIKVKASGDLGKKTSLDGHEIVSTDLYSSYYFQDTSVKHSDSAMISDYLYIF